jgi:hypothetical protein
LSAVFPDIVFDPTPIRSSPQALPVAGKIRSDARIDG